MHLCHNIQHFHLHYLDHVKSPEPPANVMSVQHDVDDILLDNG
jgi:hypothetical protein